MTKEQIHQLIKNECGETFAKGRVSRLSTIRMVFNSDDFMKFVAAFPGGVLPEHPNTLWALPAYIESIANHESMLETMVAWINTNTPVFAQERHNAEIAGGAYLAKKLGNVPLPPPYWAND